MNVTFDTANNKDISELIRLRIEYIRDDYGSISEDDKHAMILGEKMKREL